VSAPVERTIKYATTVGTLPEAWAFVMAHVDGVGPEPSIHIGPVWVYGDGLNGRHFEVAVEGMTEAAPDA
jgi:hypothetical protein